LLLFPTLALCGDENGESALGLDPEAQIIAEAVGNVSTGGG
jgi:hypothetical protein